MRIFIALLPPINFLTALETALEPLKDEHPELRWVDENSIHCTLKFFGEIDNRALSVLCEAVCEAASETKLIDARSGALCALPRGKAPNVLALGFERGGDKAAVLSAKITRKFSEKARYEGIVFNEEKRRFMAHITIARSGRHGINVHPEIFNKIPHMDFELCNIGVMSSELRREGAVYTKLAEFSLIA